MKLTSVRLANMKSFADSGEMALSLTVNVLLGPNNAGKSTILRGLRFFQQGHDFRPQDVRLGASQLTVQVGAREKLENLGLAFEEKVEITSTLSRDGVSPNLTARHPRTHATFSRERFPNIEPTNIFYQYLSKRKVAAIEEVVNEQSTRVVAADLRYLVSKVARLSKPSTPSHTEYMEYMEYMDACQRILGFPITEFASPGGQKVGRVVDNFEAIALEDMGEGVASLVGLIVDLCVADGKIFLVEEPENDLHPKALKALLDLIAVKSETNQFLISTHSNIVARHLGALPGARLLYVDQDPSDPMATSTVTDVGTDPASRIEVLAELGYELRDFDLFEGWLILEESSAERIIRDYLVPWFAPRLTRVRLVAAGGTSKVEPTFEDFHRLFRFTHLEQRYHDRAFVLLDGDPAGQEAVARLRQTFSSWDETCFDTFAETDFERYYPAEFKDRVEQVLSIVDKRQRRAAKKELLDQVIAWADADRDRARDAFESSAADVIDRLVQLDQRLFG